MQGDDSAEEYSLMAAVRELQTLSRMPLPLFRAPPWEAIRAALPSGIMLPDGPVHVLVDVDIDATGTVAHAAVGRIPLSIDSGQVFAACTDPGGVMTIRPPLGVASPELAQAVAASFLGAQFSPGERDGRTVPVRKFRMSIEVPPSAIWSSAAL